MAEMHSLHGKPITQWPWYLKTQWHCRAVFSPCSGVTDAYYLTCCVFFHRSNDPVQHSVLNDVRKRDLLADYTISPLRSCKFTGISIAPPCPMTDFIDAMFSVTSMTAYYGILGKFHEFVKRFDNTHETIPVHIDGVLYHGESTDSGTAEAGSAEQRAGDDDPSDPTVRIAG